ncbi:Active breakpoint cluster region-related protein [Trichoplax sp. H2]|nr:Active breakpoint cluster region-related protein [Trichoplax sp. H2]|eukprot:RDD38231.1 Active breakpoint cluster region-related protein [Trichoplax sp. H2]
MDTRTDREKFTAAWKLRFPNVEMPPWKELEQEHYSSACQKKMDLMKLALEMEEFQLQWMKNNTDSLGTFQDDSVAKFVDHQNGRDGYIPIDQGKVMKKAIKVSEITPSDRNDDSRKPRARKNPNRYLHDGMKSGTHFHYDSSCYSTAASGEEGDGKDGTTRKSSHVRFRVKSDSDGESSLQTSIDIGFSDLELLNDPDLIDNGVSLTKAEVHLSDNETPTTDQSIDMLALRKLSLSKLVDSERLYLDNLEIMTEYMQFMMVGSRGDYPIINIEEIHMIFYKVEELQVAHKKFYKQLEPRLTQWSKNQIIGDLFEDLMKHLYIYNNYISNYPKALEKIEKYSQEILFFEQLVKKVNREHFRQHYRLQESIQKPIERVAGYFIIVNEMMKNTPDSHPDAAVFAKISKKLTKFLQTANRSSQARVIPIDKLQTMKISNKHAVNAKFELIKSAVVAELDGNTRKSRHLFLMSDVLICSRQKAPSNQQQEVRWHIPKSKLLLSMDSHKTEAAQIQAENAIAASKKEVNKIKASIAITKSEIRSTKRQTANNNKPVKKIQIARQLVKLNNKLGQQCYVLLFLNEDDREEWKSAIIDILHLATRPIYSISSQVVNSILSQIRPDTTVQMVAEQIIRKDADYLKGMLTVEIHSGMNFPRNEEFFCSIDVDSYGYFIRKAQTATRKNTTIPLWNEKFEIEVEGAKLLRIRCVSKKKKEHQILSSASIEILSLRLEVMMPRSVTLRLSNNSIIKLTLCYTNDWGLIKSNYYATTVFGVELNQVMKQASSMVPLAVATCVEEIERRGLYEVGIYRVNGSTSEMQRLRIAFDKSYSIAIRMLHEANIFSVCGILKQYFHELPHPLITESIYPQFIQAHGLRDIQQKRRRMYSLLESLPEPNKTTFYYMLDHIIKVGRNEVSNRMSFRSLSTVFGSVFMRATTTDKEKQVKFAITHSEVFLTCLQIRIAYNKKNQALILSKSKGKARKANNQERLSADENVNNDIHDIVPVTTADASVIDENLDEDNDNQIKLKKSDRRVYFNQSVGENGRNDVYQEHNLKNIEKRVINSSDISRLGNNLNSQKNDQYSVRDRTYGNADNGQKDSVRVHFQNQEQNPANQNIKPTQMLMDSVTRSNFTDKFNHDQSKQQIDVASSTASAQQFQKGAPVIKSQYPSNSLKVAMNKQAQRLYQPVGTMDKQRSRPRSHQNPLDTDNLHQPNIRDDKGNDIRLRNQYVSNQSQSRQNSKQSSADQQKQRELTRTGKGILRVNSASAISSHQNINRHPTLPAARPLQQAMNLQMNTETFNKADAPLQTQPIKFTDFIKQQMPELIRMYQMKNKDQQHGVESSAMANSNEVLDKFPNPDESSEITRNEAKLQPVRDVNSSEHLYPRGKKEYEDKFGSSTIKIEKPTTESHWRYQDQQGYSNQAVKSKVETKGKYNAVSKKDTDAQTFRQYQHINPDHIATQDRLVNQQSYSQDLLRERQRIRNEMRAIKNSNNEDSQNRTSSLAKRTNSPNLSQLQDRSQFRQLENSHLSDIVNENRNRDTQIKSTTELDGQKPTVRNYSNSNIDNITQDERSIRELLRKHTPELDSENGLRSVEQNRERLDHTANLESFVGGYSNTEDNQDVLNHQAGNQPPIAPLDQSPDQLRFLQFVEKYMPELVKRFQNNAVKEKDGGGQSHPLDFYDTQVIDQIIPDAQNSITDHETYQYIERSMPRLDHESKAALQDQTSAARKQSAKLNNNLKMHSPGTNEKVENQDDSPYSPALIDYDINYRDQQARSSAEFLEENGRRVMADQQLSTDTVIDNIDWITNPQSTNHNYTMLKSQRSASQLHFDRNNDTEGHILLQENDQKVMQNQINQVNEIQNCFPKNDSLKSQYVQYLRDEERTSNRISNQGEEIEMADKYQIINHSSQEYPISSIQQSNNCEYSNLNPGNNIDMEASENYYPEINEAMPANENADIMVAVPCKAVNRGNYNISSSSPEVQKNTEMVSSLSENDASWNTCISMDTNNSQLINVENLHQLVAPDSDNSASRLPPISEGFNQSDTQNSHGEQLSWPENVEASYWSTQEGLNWHNENAAEQPSYQAQDNQTGIKDLISFDDAIDVLAEEFDNCNRKAYSTAVLDKILSMNYDDEMNLLKFDDAPNKLLDVSNDRGIQSHNIQEEELYVSPNTLVDMDTGFQNVSARVPQNEFQGPETSTPKDAVTFNDIANVNYDKSVGIRKSRAPNNSIDQEHSLSKENSSTSTPFAELQAKLSGHLKHRVPTSKTEANLASDQTFQQVTANKISKLEWGNVSDQPKLRIANNSQNYLREKRHSAERITPGEDEVSYSRRKLPVNNREKALSRRHSAYTETLASRSYQSSDHAKSRTDAVPRSSGISSIVSSLLVDSTLINQKLRGRNNKSQKLSHDTSAPVSNANRNSILQKHTRQNSGERNIKYTPEDKVIKSGKTSKDLDKDHDKPQSGKLSIHKVADCITSAIVPIIGLNASDQTTSAKDPFRKSNTRRSSDGQALPNIKHKKSPKKSTNNRIQDTYTILPTAVSIPNDTKVDDFNTSANIVNKRNYSNPKKQLDSVPVNGTLTNGQKRLHQRTIEHVTRTRNEIPISDSTDFIQNRKSDSAYNIHDHNHELIRVDDHNEFTMNKNQVMAENFNYDVDLEEAPTHHNPRNKFSPQVSRDTKQRSMDDILNSDLITFSDQATSNNVSIHSSVNGLDQRSSTSTLSSKIPQNNLGGQYRDMATAKQAMYLDQPESDTTEDQQLVSRLQNLGSILGWEENSSISGSDRSKAFITRAADKLSTTNSSGHSQSGRSPVISQNYNSRSPLTNNIHERQGNIPENTITSPFGDVVMVPIDTLISKHNERYVPIYNDNEGHTDTSEDLTTMTKTHVDRRGLPIKSHKSHSSTSLLKQLSTQLKLSKPDSEKNKDSLWKIMRSKSAPGTPSSMPSDNAAATDRQVSRAQVPSYQFYPTLARSPDKHANFTPSNLVSPTSAKSVVVKRRGPSLGGNPESQNYQYVLLKNSNKSYITDQIPKTSRYSGNNSTVNTIQFQQPQINTHHSRILAPNPQQNHAEKLYTANGIGSNQKPSAQAHIIQQTGLNKSTMPQLHSTRLTSSVTPTANYRSQSIGNNSSHRIGTRDNFHTYQNCTNMVSSNTPNRMVMPDNRNQNKRLMDLQEQTGIKYSVNGSSQLNARSGIHSTNKSPNYYSELSSYREASTRPESPSSSTEDVELLTAEEGGFEIEVKSHFKPKVSQSRENRHNGKTQVLNSVPARNVDYSSSGSDTILLTADEGPKYSPSKVKSQTHVSIISTFNPNIIQISSDDETALQTADEFVPSLSSEEESCYLSCSSVESRHSRKTKYYICKDAVSYTSKIFNSNTTEISRSIQPPGPVYTEVVSVQNYSVTDDLDHTIANTKNRLKHSSCNSSSLDIKSHNSLRQDKANTYRRPATSYPSSISSDVSDGGWPSREETDSDNENSSFNQGASKIRRCDTRSSDSDSTIVSSKFYRVTSLASSSSLDSDIEGHNEKTICKTNFNSDKIRPTNKIFNIDPKYIQSMVVDMLQKQLACSLNGHESLKLTNARQNGKSTDQAYICIDQGKKVPVTREVFNEIVKLRQRLA